MRHWPWFLYHLMLCLNWILHVMQGQCQQVWQVWWLPQMHALLA